MFEKMLITAALTTADAVCTGHERSSRRRALPRFVRAGVYLIRGILKLVLLHPQAFDSYPSTGSSNFETFAHHH